MASSSRPGALTPAAFAAFFFACCHRMRFAHAVTTRYPDYASGRAASPHPSKKGISGFDALNVLAGARIDTHFIARVDEKRHVHDCTGLQGRRLGDVVGGIAAHTWLGTLDEQLQEVGHLYRDDVLAIDQHLDLILLLEKLDRVAQHLFRDGLLIVGLGVHKDIVAAVDVQKLPVLVLDTHLVYIFTRTETLLDHTAIFQVFEACTHERAPVSGTDVMKLGNRPQITVITNDHAVAKIGCRCISHRNSSSLTRASHLLYSQDRYATTCSVVFMLVRSQRYWLADRALR